MDVCRVGWFTLPRSSVGIFTGAVHGTAARHGAKADLSEYAAPAGGTWPAPGDWDQPVIGPGQVLLGVRLCDRFGQTGNADRALEAIMSDAGSYGATPFVRPNRPW